ncbi:MAG: NYN domain-containing protein [Marivita sp.]|uniref:NYN domain-containing protein n=1 Tax=Marivita sp. TaxID=2003365 RepID=UPI003EF8BEDA
MSLRKENIAVLIDGHALSIVSQGLGLKPDFRKLRTSFSSMGRLRLIKYYNVVVENDGFENSIIKVLDWLEYNGYRVFRKMLRPFENDPGNRRIKGSITAEIAVDLVLQAQSVDQIYLIGNSVDYVYAVTEAQRLGVSVTLVSTLNADGCRPAVELRRAVDDFIDIDDFRAEMGSSVAQMAAE